MPSIEVANDVSIKTEAVPDSSPAAYFAADASAAIVAAGASNVVVTGVVQSATETQDAGSLHQLVFQLRAQVEGSDDGAIWHPLGAPGLDLIATFVDANGKQRSAAPNAFQVGPVGVAGFAHVRVYWSFDPVDPDDPQKPPPPLVADLAVVLTAHVSLLDPEAP